MIEIFCGSLLLLIGLLTLVLQRTYTSLPIKELRRQARGGNTLARQLYRSAVYGQSLRVLLWAIVITTVPIGLVLLVSHFELLPAVGLLLAVCLVMLVWIPALRPSFFTARFAAMVSPAFVWVLELVHAPLQRLLSLPLLERRHGLPHSGLYEADDLAELLDRQEGQSDNRMEPHVLDRVRRALRFDTRHARDILQPRETLQLVNADDSIGPVLLDQMYSHGQKVCLVYKDKETNIIGSLHMSDAAKARQGGRVLDLIRADVVFIHEDFTLRQILGVFQESGQHIAAVVNRFEEFVGVVTFGALVGELVGELGASDVGNYSDKRAVAAYRKPEEVAEIESVEEQPALSPDSAAASLAVTEVIE